MEASPIVADVGTPCCDYQCQVETWQMIHNLLGGTKTMREAGQIYLPKDERETEEAWEARLSHTFLYNGFGNTVDRLTAKPFSKPVTIQGKLPPEIEAVTKNVDGTGTTLTQFGRAVLKSGIKYGVVHTLIDFTKVPEGATRADEQALGARPMMVLVEAPSLLAWRTEVGPNGLELTRVNIQEIRTEPDGEWGDQKVKYVRVISKTEWALYRETEGKDENGKTTKHWEDAGKGTHTFGEVPLKSYYVCPDGFMMGKCPIEDLAWINVRHWQSSSQQNSALRLARLGILFGAGFTEDEVKRGITISSNHMILSENENARLEFVQHNGQSIGAGKEDLDKLEMRMEVLGLKPLIERTSNSTMGGKMLDEMSTHSNIQSWVRGLEDYLLDCLQACAKWLKKTIDEKVKIDIYSDFGLASADAVHLDALLQAAIAGLLDDETFLEEYQRRAVLSENHKIKELLDRVAAGRKAKDEREIKVAKETAPPQTPPSSAPKSTAA